ncbi:hypothetical protein [Microcoleus sp.]|uniref:hypothetical protein n=1 Tax=Microcoleus sp. TaxID=44472 RepID=UPI003523D807
MNNLTIAPVTCSVCRRSQLGTSSPVCFGEWRSSLSTKPRVDRDFSRVPGRVLHHSAETSGKMLVALQKEHTSSSPI